MKLGFIGTGKIASSVIRGICSSKISFTKILISSRNKKISSNLKKKFKKVIIAKNNQEIVDKCNWVFLSITPAVGKKVIVPRSGASTPFLKELLSKIGINVLEIHLYSHCVPRLIV